MSTTQFCTHPVNLVYSTDMLISLVEVGGSRREDFQEAMSIQFCQSVASLPSLSPSLSQTPEYAANPKRISLFSTKRQQTAHYSIVRALKVRDFF